MERVCLTINNWSYVDLIKFTEDKSIFKYYVVGFETSPKTGTEHLQCYVEFSSNKSFKMIKNLFPRAHIEEATDSQEANLDYCTKSGNYLQYVDGLLKTIDSMA